MPWIKTELRRRAQARLAAPAPFRRVEVRRNRALGPRFRRVTIGGAELAGFPGGELPADAVKLFLPLPGQSTVTLPTRTPDGRLQYPTGDRRPDARAYTVRRFDPHALELDVDVVMHGASTSTRWASAAQPGDELALTGPRHDFYASPEVDHHLVVGDETALPAIATILEHLPAQTQVTAVVEVDQAAEELPLRTAPGTRVYWVHRGGKAPGSTDLLLRTVRDLDWPAGEVQAWVGAETGVARAVRSLLRERGVRPECQQVSGYWRRGLSSAELDELALRRYRRAQATGEEIDDLAPEDDAA
ncbi:MAG: siderophore-interacting protein [Streptosporangiales bacterium]|nr:siderophore-interacting protein [Streptosporangiales bacterium]